MIDYTLVVGVDYHHLDQLSHTWPTWIRHKPDLLARPMVVFYDLEQVKEQWVRNVITHPNLKTVPWPSHEWVRYCGDPKDKWTNPQRYKMLAGFVHVPATHVETSWWLKIDTDTVAYGEPNWIDPDWFNEAAIVAHRWSFTKPADQMLKLDRWVDDFASIIPGLAEQPPLNLTPQPGSDRLGHKRIISWCGFFNTMMTSMASRFAERTVGQGLLPVPSQDGYLFYVAKRLGLGIRQINAKRLGWEHWHTMGNVVRASERAMK